jgi:hypothetical protein
LFDEFEFRRGIISPRLIRDDIRRFNTWLQWYAAVVDNWCAVEFRESWYVNSRFNLKPVKVSFEVSVVVVSPTSGLHVVMVVVREWLSVIVQHHDARHGTGDDSDLVVGPAGEPFVYFQTRRPLNLVSGPLDGWYFALRFERYDAVT